jgi:hypothetical protein
MIWDIAQNAKDTANLIRKKIEVFVNFVISFIVFNVIKNIIHSNVVKCLFLAKTLTNSTNKKKREIKEKLRFSINLRIKEKKGKLSG